MQLKSNTMKILKTIQFIVFAMTILLAISCKKDKIQTSTKLNGIDLTVNGTTYQYDSAIWLKIQNKIPYELIGITSANYDLQHSPRIPVGCDTIPKLAFGFTLSNTGGIKTNDIILNTSYTNFIGDNGLFFALPNGEKLICTAISITFSKISQTEMIGTISGTGYLCSSGNTQLPFTAKFDITKIEDYAY